LTLSTKGSFEEQPVGLIAPRGRTPWGCLFFIILALGLLLGLASRHWAVIFIVVSLIVFWGAYNSPRRVAAENVQRTLSLLGARKAERAAQALEPALRRLPHDDGLHYLAALLALARDYPAEALAELEEARPRMGIYAEFHHLLGRCLRDLKRPDQARAAYEEALDYPAYPSRAVLLQEAEDFFAQHGDTGTAARLREIRQEIERPDSEAAKQAFQEGLERLDPGDE